MYEIELYKDKNGESKVENYIIELRNKNSKDSRIKFDKIMSYIRLLGNEGLSY